VTQPSTLPTLRAGYTVSELAGLAGWNPQRMRRFLCRRGIPRRQVNADDKQARTMVLLADLAAAEPGLWASMRLRLESVGQAMPMTAACQLCGSVIELGAHT